MPATARGRVFRAISVDRSRTLLILVDPPPRFLSPSLVLLSFPSYWDSTFTRAVTILDMTCLPVEHGMNVDAYDNEVRTAFSLRYKDTVAMSHQEKRYRQI